MYKRQVSHRREKTRDSLELKKVKSQVGPKISVDDFDSYIINWSVNQVSHYAKEAAYAKLTAAHN